MCDRDWGANLARSEWIGAGRIQALEDRGGLRV
jgi:hypothetical protein